MLIDRAMRLLAAATFLLGIGFGGLSAEAPAAPEAAPADAPNGYEVTVFNAHRYAVDVYFDVPGGDDQLLGSVDSDAVKSFDAPAAHMDQKRKFRVEIRTTGPQAGLGQSRTTARRILETPAIPDPFDGEIKLIVTPNLDNSSVDIVKYID